MIPSSLQEMTFGSNELIYVPGSPLPITVEEFEDDEVVDNVIPTAPPRTKVAKTSCAELAQSPAFTLDQNSQVANVAAPETLPRTRRGKSKQKNDPSESLNNPTRLYATVPPRTKYSTVSHVCD